MQNVNTKASRSSLPFFMVFSLLISSLCDLPTYHNISGFSGTAILSSLYVLILISWIPMIIQMKLPPVLLYAIPFLLFSVWNICLLFFLGADKAGYQTVTLYLNFFLNLIFVALYCRNFSLRTINTYFILISFVISFLYFTVIASNGIGQSGIIGRRSFALEAIVLLSWFAMQKKSNLISARWLIWILFLLIFLSLSRTAMILAIAIIFLRILRRKPESSTFTFRKLALTLVLSFISVVALIRNSELFRERVTGGDRAFSIGGYSISSQGRSRIWNTIIDNSKDSKWIGQGPGSVRALISERIPGQTEPHNEFLRIYYESGVIGLSLFCAGIISIAILIYRNRGKLEQLRSSTLAASICFLVVAMTDNPSVYIFVVLPVSTILGIYLAQVAESSK